MRSFKNHSSYITVTDDDINHPLAKALIDKGYSNFELIFAPTFATDSGWTVTEGMFLPLWLGYTKKMALKVIEKLNTFQEEKMKLDRKCKTNNIDFLIEQYQELIGFKDRKIYDVRYISHKLGYFTNLKGVVVKIGDKIKYEHKYKSSYKMEVNLYMDLYFSVRRILCKQFKIHHWIYTDKYTRFCAQCDKYQVTIGEPDNSRFDKFKTT